MTEQTDSRETAAPKRGHEVIQAYLRTLDSSPGVYRMLDEQSRVLYVGKARNLRARVSSYARPTGHSGRIARMIRETASMMFLTTRTETEALLLEQNLIKQLKPRYNVLLRDDKSFPNILVAKDHAFPQILKHRGAKKDKGAYYGPFASAGAVNRTLNQLQKVFLLRNCSDSMFEGRSRPCLLYQIKRCSGPCVGHISEADYAASVKDAEDFLQGRTTRVQSQLAKEMEAASEAMEFERAAALRDRIRALNEAEDGMGKHPFKPYHQRLEPEPFLASDEDDSWEPALQTLRFWSDHYRRVHQQDWDHTPTLVTEAKYLRHHLEWIVTHEPNADVFAADVNLTRTRLETVLTAGRRPERTRVECTNPTCENPRQLIKTYGRRYVVAHTCRTCDTTCQRSLFQKITTCRRLHELFPPFV